MKITKSKSFDILGISSAGICLIHCLVFPLLTILPLGLSHNHFIDLIFACIGLYAILRIKNLKEKRWIQFILYASITLIFIAVIGNLVFHNHSPLIYVGALGLIIGHILNFKKHK